MVGGGPAVAATAVALLAARRGDLRLAGLVAVVFGVAGVFLGATSGAAPPAPLLLGATSALLGAALAPLALPGVLLAGRWVWAGAPRRRPPIAVAAAVTGLAALLAAIVPATAAALAVSSAAPAEVGRLVVLAAGTAAAALLAGVLVPWRGEGLGDQLASFGAFAACGAAASAGVGVAGPRLVAAGLPAAVTAAALAGSVLAVAVVAVARTVGRPC